jgi:hypothetical protein
MALSANLDIGAGVPKGTGVWQTHQDFVLIQTQN